MRKINSLFIRDKANPRLVTREVDPECQWVIDGEGVATVKYDGSACAVLFGILYKRHRHDASKGDPPTGWIHWSIDTGQQSGHGWLPCVPADSASRYHLEAWEECSGQTVDGTYELVGPKVNGNPHRAGCHTLWQHGQEVLMAARDFDGLKEWFGMNRPLEGIVWHHPDGRMAKIKRCDFGLPWPVQR